MATKVIHVQGVSNLLPVYTEKGRVRGCRMAADISPHQVCDYMSFVLERPIEWAQLLETNEPSWFVG